MRKFTILILVILIPLVSSIEFEMKTEFDQGETLLAKISGNFLDQITEENIFFYRGHIRIPVVYDIGKIDDDFYIYAMLTGKGLGDYSIKIKDVKYMEGVEIIEEDIVKEFAITDDIAAFSLNPGFKITSGNFSLKVQNLQSQKIEIKIKTPEEFISENSIELKSGEIENINFGLNIEDSIFEEMELKSGGTSYLIPVFANKVNITEQEEELNFKFEPNFVNVSMAEDSNSKRIIYIRNIGDLDAENITLSFSSSLNPYVNVSPQQIETLEKDSNEKIEIDIISNSEPEEIEGTITAISENFSAFMTLTLNFIEDYIPEEFPENENAEIATTCFQLGGIICEDDEECTGELTPAKDGLCCLAQCETIKKSSTGKIIGWIIVAAIILLLLWFFKKYKKVKPKIDLMKIGKRKK